MRTSPLLFALLCLSMVAAFASSGQSAPKRLAHRSSVTEGLDCSACHTPDTWRSMGASSGSSGFDHDKTGFPLTHRHALVSCLGCHNAQQTLTRQCAGCHQDPHANKLGNSCDDCHSAVSFTQTDVVARHRQSRLPLTGMHALVECRDCHRKTTEGQWDSPPADCYACHADDYRRPDIHPPHVGTFGDPDNPAFPRECTQCHREVSWVPAFVPAPLVAEGFALTKRRTARALNHEMIFPLASGSHRGSTCRDCHRMDAGGRVVRPQAVRCNGCHAHNPKRTAAQHQTVVGFTRSCLSCHPAGAVR